MVSSIENFVSLPIIAEIFDRLQRELPAEYTFHSAQHARDVMHEAILFSETESRSKREVELLAIAAAYHDAGFLQQAIENEAIGAEIATAALIEHGGYSDDEVQLVQQMICDTRLIPGEDGLYQSASNDLSRYLLDADVSNFGRADFFDKLERLIQERGVERLPELYATLKLMKNHDWLTDAARSLREDKKQENIAQLEALLK